MRSQFYNNYTDIENWLKRFNVQNYDIVPDKIWDFIVNVDGDVLIDDFNLSFIPIKFGKVSGRFNVSNNDMENLIGSPDEVGGNFLCQGSKIKSLEGAPRIIGGDFDCSHNHIESLNGGPRAVGGDYECSACSLTTLRGAPEKINGIFICSYNNLVDLIGGPRYVGRSYICGDCTLESLVGSPEFVGGEFNCCLNLLENLDVFPNEVEGEFSCSMNPKLGEKQEIRDVKELHIMRDRAMLEENLDRSLDKGLGEQKNSIFIGQAAESVKLERILKI